MTDVVLPILYSFRRCPYAMRARMALIVSGVACEIREILLRDKPAAMIAASAKATVPVLVLPDGAVIDESLEIMRLVLGRHDPEGWRHGDDRTLIAANDGAFKHHLDCYKYPDRHGSDPIEHRAAALAMLGALEVRLAGSAQLCGAERTLADMAILPFVRQFAAVDPAWFAAQALPGVQRWLAWHIGSSLFERAMVKLPVWREGDAVTVFPGA